MDAMVEEAGIQRGELTDRPSRGGRSYHRMVHDALEQLGPRREAWEVRTTPDHDAVWIQVRHRAATPPDQGWKLHVSAGLSTAEPVLAQVLPVLLNEDTHFKIAATSAVLMRLNEGEGGLSQVGKFITIYPNGDSHAGRLGRALDAVTRGLRGPAVLSDRPVAPGSLVHYRFGGFAERFIRTPVGETLPALAAPNGELIPDLRQTRFTPPEWVRDPFAPDGDNDDTAPQVIAGRYVLLALWHESPRGAVHLALDLVSHRRCVVKSARRDGLLGFDGRDACAGLRHEAAILRRLAPDARYPTVLDLVEGHNGDLCLVLNDVEGDPLSDVEGEHIRFGRTLPRDRVIAWGRELAHMLGDMHACGIIYRDLKAPNVIAAPDSTLRLVDFGTAHIVGCMERPYGLGTRGYMSPQQAVGATPSVTDDVYSLGALLFLLATGAQPELAPDTGSLLARPLVALNPSISPALADIITRCLSPDAGARFSTMAALDAALATAAAETITRTVPYGSAAMDASESELAAQHDAAAMARQLGDTLCASARPAPDDTGSTWGSRDALTSGLFGRDISSGAAGAILALAGLVEAFGVRAHRATLADAARWLQHAPAANPLLPGLYVGEAGVGAALLRAGQVLGDEDLIADAASRGQRIAAMPHTSPDIFNGTAGRLRFHLLLWDETGAAEHLDHATAAGERLREMATWDAQNGARWIMPRGYDSLSETASLGYAHGAAGIADALLDLYESTHDLQYLEIALETARWLAPQAISTLDDDSGLDWPATETTPTGGPFWCHGAVGVGRFVLHLATLGVSDDAWHLAMGAARAAARGARWANPTQCHGLAGNIEYLLDIYQASGDNAHLIEARSLARLLSASAVDHAEGIVWPGESSERIAPDFMVGYAGVAACFLRLADPQHRPHQLSRSGFRPHHAWRFDCP